MKLKSFIIAKQNKTKQKKIDKQKIQPTEWEKMKYPTYINSSYNSTTTNKQPN